MTSVVDICNMALSNKLGASRITSLVDDTKEARECSLAYPHTRDYILSKHPWNCTVERVVLAPLVTAPVFEYDYAYQVPADSMKILGVDTKLDWYVEGGKIVTDEGPTLNVAYKKKVTDPEQFPPYLVELIVTRLAYTICESITQSTAKKQELKRDYNEVDIEAKRVDAQEGSGRTLSEDSWVEARR